MKEPKAFSESKVVIAVPTYKRPKRLAGLLQSISGQTYKGKNVFVVVADNEGENGAGLNLLKAEEYVKFPYEIKGLPVAQRGIARVRNAIIEECFSKMGADCVVMVDDDQWVEHDWLENLLHMYNIRNADIIKNNIIPDFVDGKPAWVEGQKLYGYSKSTGDGLVPLIYGTNGVLLSRSILRLANGEYFDDSYALIGGEDDEFFFRMKKNGAVFAYAQKAISHEIFDRFRSSRVWACKRSFNRGIAFIRALIKNGQLGIFGWSKEILKITAGLVVPPFVFLIPFMSSRQRMKIILLFFSQVGKVSGAIGIRVNEYQTTHGV